LKKKTQKKINLKDVYVVGSGSSGSGLFVGSEGRSGGFFCSTEGAKVSNGLSDINLLENILVYVKVTVKVQQYRYRPGVAQRVPGS
jgi:hypothetical protein